MADIDDLDAIRTIVTTLEGFERADQERILRWSTEKLGISITPQAQTHAPQQQAAPASQVEQQSTPHAPAIQFGSKDIKSFVTEKSPSSDNQFAATIAYFYLFEAAEEEQKESITSADLQDACRKVGRSRLGDPGKTLRNAHNMGYLDKADRGSYKINTVGENLVAVTLPSGNGGGTAKAAPKKRKSPVKKAKPKAKAKSKAKAKK